MFIRSKCDLEAAGAAVELLGPPCKELPVPQVCQAVGAGGRARGDSPPAVVGVYVGLCAGEGKVDG
jgi:hypothetical protein